MIHKTSFFRKTFGQLATWLRTSCTRKFFQNKSCLGLLYFSLIPIFALAYWFLPPQSFYHSTSLYERGNRELRVSLQNELRTLLIERAKAVTGSEKIKSENWEMDAEEFNVQGLEITDDHIVKFMLSNTTIDPTKLETGMRQNGSRPVEIEEVARVWWVNLQFLLVSGGDLPESRRIGNVSVTARWPDNAILFWKVFPFILENGDFFEDTNLRYRNSFKFEMPTRVIELLYVWDNYMRGFPDGAPNHLYRMFYLSAVTITTLGYGDIAPLTGWARFLVGLESVLGILLMGLFVNAVWSSRNP